MADLKSAPPSTAGFIPDIPLTSILTLAESSELKWRGVEGATYEIEFSTTLKPEDWSLVGAARAGEDGSLSFTHEQAQTSQGYYRVRRLQSVD